MPPFFPSFFVSHAPPIESCLYHMSSLSPRSPLHVLLLLRAPPHTKWFKPVHRDYSLFSFFVPPSPPRPCSSNVPVLHYSHVPSHASFFSIFFVSHAPPINSCLYHKSSLSPTSPLHVLFLLRDPPPPLPTFSFFFSHPFTILFRSFVIFFLFFYKNRILLWSILGLCRQWPVLALYRLLMMGEVPKYIYCISMVSFLPHHWVFLLCIMNRELTDCFTTNIFFGGGVTGSSPTARCCSGFQQCVVWLFLAMVCQLKWAENWTSLEKTGCVCLL